MRLFFLTLFPVLCVLTGCIDYDGVVYQGFENVNLGKSNQGMTNISFNIKLDNPNAYNIKIKSSDLTIYLGGKELGDVHLTDRLVIQKQTAKSYPVEVSAKLKDIAKAGIVGLVELATKKTISIRYKGFVRASVFGITQKRYIDESKDIETKQLLRLFGS